MGCCCSSRGQNNALHDNLNAVESDSDNKEEIEQEEVDVDDDNTVVIDIKNEYGKKIGMHFERV